MTDAELAARLARELGPLAVDAQWSVAATANQLYGHYTDAMADAKAVLGVDGALDQATLTTVQLQELIQRALLACLERLELHYATLVDTTVGSGDGAQQQKLSQVRAAISQVRGRLASAVHARSTAVSDAPPAARGVRLRGRRRPDYTLGEGDGEE